MYANKNYKTDGKVYYMPNKIFDENFSPHEFMIYCFLVSVGDSKGICFWSVPKLRSVICVRLLAETRLSHLKKKVT